jgi:dethiobiotin synthetase
MDGLLILGTGPRCGKTVLCGGLAAALNQSGLAVQAAKPLMFSAPDTLQPVADDPRFLALATRAYTVPEAQVVAGPHQVNNMIWTRLVETCRRMPLPTLVESPGATLTSPLKFDGADWLDGLALARQIQAPILLVTRKSPDLIGETAPALALLQQAADQGLEVVGWVGVETLPVVAPHWESEAWMLAQRYRLPYLGVMPYSSGISVEALRTDPVLPLAEEALDLLPIQHALKLVV